EVGQPVLIGGTMGTASYILTGTKEAMEKSFGSTCHGAGRIMSRTKAKKEFWGKNVVKKLKNERNIIIKAHSMSGAAEEAPGAYKNIDKVAESVEKAGISKRVAKVKPMAVIKG
ncbi:MAG: RtcB family protein, partial [archaeon]